MARKFLGFMLLLTFSVSAVAQQRQGVAITVYSDKTPDHDRALGFCSPLAYKATFIIFGEREGDQERCDHVPGGVYRYAHSYRVGPNGPCERFTSPEKFAEVCKRMAGLL